MSANPNQKEETKNETGPKEAPKTEAENKGDDKKTSTGGAAWNKNKKS